jgi:hypothetical protein
MLVHAYLDESGTNDQAPIETMAGWVIEPDRLPLFNAEWQEVLAHHGVTEAKAAGLAAVLERTAKNSSDFDGWDKAKAAVYRASLNAVIERHMRFGVIAGVIKADYEKVIVSCLESAGPLRDPYRWLMQTSLEHCAVPAFQIKKPLNEPLPRRLNPEDRVLLTFDRGHPKPGVTETYFMDLTTDQTCDIAKIGAIVPRYEVADSRLCPALQAADHLAWAAKRGFERFVTGLSGDRVTMAGVYGLKEVLVIGGLWDKTHLLQCRTRIIGR